MLSSNSCTGNSSTHPTASLNVFGGNSYVEVRRPQGTASLNMFGNTPSVDVQGPGKTSITLEVFAGVPSIEVKDREGYMATLGGTDLKSTSTGTVEKRSSAASLVLFNTDGKVIWSAP